MINPARRLHCSLRAVAIGVTATAKAQLTGKETVALRSVAGIEMAKALSAN